jgi:anti-sigma B factor antagonist
MNIETTQSGQTLVVTVKEKRLDAKIAVSFKDKMAEFINAGNVLLVLNLAQVEFIDSSGLGAIVTSLKVLGRRGDLVIANVASDVMIMFSLTRMDKVFRIFSSTEDAVAALA